jgi:aminoglycoside phosphotransferase (APT) family kinase protein
VGLGDYGRPGNYFERQIGRWTPQYWKTSWPGATRTWMRWSHGCPRHSGDDDDHVVHGDFRCDNMIFHPPSRAFWRCSTGNCPRWAIRWPILPITR